jgi:oligopeptidase A
MLPPRHDLRRRPHASRRHRASQHASDSRLPVGQHADRAHPELRRGPRSSGVSDFAELCSFRMAKDTRGCSASSRIARRSKPHAVGGYGALAFARTARLPHWKRGTSRMAEKLRKSRATHSPMRVRVFSEDRVSAGCFSGRNALWRRNPANAPTWHRRCVFRRIGSRHSLVGQFYLDLYARPGKPAALGWMTRSIAGAWARRCSPVACPSILGPLGDGASRKPATFTHDKS